MGTLLLAVGLVVGSNPGERYDAATVREPAALIKVGMTSAEVEKILGEEARGGIASPEMAILIYQKAALTVVFGRNGKVTEVNRLRQAGQGGNR